VGRVAPLIAGLTAALIAALSFAPAGLADTPLRQIALGLSEPNSWCITDPLPVNCPQDLNTLDSATSNYGAQPAVWSLWSDWGDKSQYSNASFPKAQVDVLAARGIMPQIYWEPVDPSYQGFDCTNWKLTTITRGKHDSYIRNWAKAAKADGHTIILRFAHEMNGYWYVWGNGVCGNTARQFRQAWKHVWTIFQNVGATNVKFEFGVLGSANVAADYPGDAYVDYLGLTALNWGKNHNKPWRSLVSSMSAGMTALRSLSTTKPIIVAEIGSGPDQSCTGCTKANWLTTGYPAVYSHTNWGQVVAMIYFDYDMTAVGQPDWRLATPPTATDAYKVLLQNPWFQGTLPQLTTGQGSR